MQRWCHMHAGTATVGGTGTGAVAGTGTAAMGMTGIATVAESMAMTGNKAGMGGEVRQDSCCCFALFAHCTVSALFMIVLCDG